MMMATRRMDEMQIGPWRVAYDREATAHAYERVPASGPERCGCQTCRNFLAARSRNYGPNLLATLNTLGVDPEREAEVVDYGPIEDQPGYRAAGGWFHVVGRVLDGPPDLTGAGAKGPVQLAVTRRTSIVPDAFEGQPVFQLEWFGAIPWVLEEEPLSPS